MRALELAKEAGKKFIEKIDDDFSDVPCERDATIGMLTVLLFLSVITQHEYEAAHKQLEAEIKQERVALAAKSKAWFEALPEDQKARYAALEKSARATRALIMEQVLALGFNRES